MDIKEIGLEVVDYIKTIEGLLNSVMKIRERHGISRAVKQLLACQEGRRYIVKCPRD
jgi:hypothetical protein